MKKIRGMKDYLYKDMDLFYHIENISNQIFLSYGFNKINTPLLENYKLFLRSIGEISDIVKKEMYTFYDLHNNKISLRPEGTSSCVRAVIENHLYKKNSFLKLWYIGPMFRYERPQKGRYRQFYQIGAEVFGSEQPDVEAELIIMIKRFWSILKLDTKELSLHINSIGDYNCRVKYIKILRNFLQKYYLSFNNTIKNTIDNNPLRIFDSKDTYVKDILLSAPKITDYLEEIDLIKFQSFQFFLKKLDIDFVVDKTLVRGLDYYSGNVFEWKTKNDNYDLTICAGGRYDNLVQMIYPTHASRLPAVGFAIGIERLILYIQLLNITHKFNIRLYKIYIVILKETLRDQAFRVAEEIRDRLLSNNLQIFIDHTYRSVKKQFSYANKNKIDVVILIGPEEIEKNFFTIKHLSKGTQYKIKKDEFVDKLKDILYM